MVAQKGSDIKMRVEDSGAGSPTSFIVVGGLRNAQVQLNGETVDVTNADSANKWRELLAGAGIKSASLNGSGVFKDDATDLAIRTSFMDGTHLRWQFDVPSFARFEGLFQITQLEFAGDHNGEVNYTLTVESAGEINAAAI